MLFSLSLFALGALALPSTVRSNYAVKERHPVPRSWTKISDSAKDEVIHLQIGLKQSNPGTIEQHLIEISDPNHRRYGQHLTASEVDSIIAPAEESSNLVDAWLAEHGIHTAVKSPAKDWVHVLIPVGKAEELLQTKYSTFRNSEGSTISRAPVWSLPEHLHEHIDVVQPTTSFFKPKEELVNPSKDMLGPVYELESLAQFRSQASNSSSPVSAVCNASLVTIECLRTVYGTINYTVQAADKNSIAIANYLNETNHRADTYQFLQTFRPEAADAANTFKIITIADANNDQGPYTPEQIADGKNLEGNLDAQLVLGIGWPTPMTAISTGGSPPFIPDIATPTDTNEPYLTFLNYALAQKDLPYVLSTSYGDDEQTVPLSYADRACSGFAQLGARGISVLFSSGDNGVGADGACFSNTNTSKPMFLPAFPAGCPWVTSVGGTAGFEPEVAVSRFGSGAGFSNYFGAPKYQRKTVNAYIASLNGLYDGLYNKSGRGYPDVAAQGNHDAIVWNGKVRSIGGTSASSPNFAAVISLVNDALLAKGKKPLGFLNPWIYGGAYKALTDITSGSSIGCDGSGFPAQAGWDAVTGFGTPRFPDLVKAAFAKQPGKYPPPAPTGYPSPTGYKKSY